MIGVKRMYLHTLVGDMTSGSGALSSIVTSGFVPKAEAVRWYNARRDDNIKHAYVHHSKK